jgi:hypothetical protein
MTEEIILIWRKSFSEEEAVRHLAYIKKQDLLVEKWTYSDQNH